MATLALDPADRINDRWRHGKMIDGIAVALAKAGLAESAMSAVAKIDDLSRYEDTVSEVAVALVAAGQDERALEIADQISAPELQITVLRALISNFVSGEKSSMRREGNLSNDSFFTQIPLTT